MNMTIIDTIYKRSLEILKFLESQNEVTYKSDYDEVFKKTLVLSIASYFESSICQIILKFTEDKTQNNNRIYNFVKNKGVSRQYHTYFNWDGKNANSFFSLFGDDFKNNCEKIIKSDSELENALRAFLELGETRNRLVHLNFADYPLSKTSDEYYNLYCKAIRFVTFIECELNK